jgi:hypothetical protein
MSHDRPDFDHEIATALADRARLQAEYDAVKNGYNTFRVIQLRGAMAEATRRLCELRSAKEADRPVESVRGSSVFFSSNN